MFLSVFEMFKVGIGPSSSHTMGPMVAAARFLDKMRASPFHLSRGAGSLHGSLAFTGVGHATDRATILGSAGFLPETYDHEKAEAALEIHSKPIWCGPRGCRRWPFTPRRI
jgi:L-serine dehydratase